MTGLARLWQSTLRGIQRVRFTEPWGRTRRWLTLRRGGAIGAALLLVVLGVVIARTWVFWLMVPALDAELAGLENWRPPTTVRVFDERGRVVDRFFLVRRVWVPIDELPEVLLQAIVAAEDRRFYRHAGVDWFGILRALIRNARAGEVRQGGSSITQQVVKNVVVGRERTLSRKLREALLALRLEQRMDKRSILELYVNLIYLGAGNYGVEAAARDYFGRSARSLQLPEAALLASLIPAPSRFSPRRDPSVALARRARVLDAMVDLGMCEESERQQALHSPVHPPPRGGPRRLGGEAYLTEVRREVRRLLGRRIPFEVGLRVHTSMNPELQAVAERAIQTAVEAIEERQGVRVEPRPSAARDRGAIEPIPVSTGTSTTPGQCMAMTVMADGRLGAGPHRWRIPVRSWARRVWNPDSTAWPTVLSRVLAPGHNVDACITSTETAEPAARPYVEGAAVVLEFESGRVVALVGGRDMPIEGFHRATQARRQAGSAFKPFVYASALEAGMTQLDTVVDAPLILDAGHHRVWKPRNAHRGFWGPVALRWAFAYSLNTAAVRLVMEHGTRRVIEHARGAGILSPLRKDLTMALGTSEVRPLELARGVAGIVRGGVSVEPTLIDRLVNVDGVEVARAGEAIRLKDLDVRLPGGEGGRFLSPGAAWETTDMMRAVIERGTGRGGFRAGEDRGGKTGTSSGYKDAWFVGFARGHVIAVWIGQDDGETLGRGESGVRAALPAWTTIADALPFRPDPERPPDVIPLPFGDQWVDVSVDHVPQARLRYNLPSRPKPLPAAPGALRCDKPRPALGETAESAPYDRDPLLPKL